MSETASNCRTSTSFTTMPPVLTDSQKGSVEDIQISLAPYIQSYLSQTGRRHSCCRVMLPVTFERAAPRSWLNPRFDSPVLEGQYQASVFPQLRLKFRFALFYILLCSLVWLLYFLLDGGPTTYTPLTVSIGLIFVFALLGLWVTGTDMYRAYTNLLSGCCALLLCMFSLALLLLTREALSPLGHFSICIEIVMLVYTIIPLPLWLCCTISVLYSICFEVLSFLQQTRFDYNSRPAGTTARNSGDAAEYYFSAGSDEPVPGPSSHGEPTADSDDDTFLYKIILIRVLIQLCVHLIGVQILIMTVVRMRGTFMKVGQNLLVRRQLEMEKQLKEKMIHSMMPPKVADLLLKESRGTTGKAAGGGSSFDQYSTATAATSRRGTPSDLKSLFRPFHMNRMENVSILFADIVGFTRMSASKTAEQLVEILNDLFERFDDLCLVNGCEKISTLGDCYYCVSGCPEPRPDHAICCVEMGLGMIESIRVFDAQRNEGIKMRVGVHTGTVLCGIVGTKRVKFDVWSNDVTLANRMESSGKPDQVHVSEETCGFLSDAYVIEEGEEVDGHRTYFVVGKKVGEEPGSSLIEPNIGLHHRHLFAATTLDEALTDGNDHAGGNSCLLHSATNVSSIEPVVPPASPAGPVSFASLQASPVTNTRPPLASLTKMTKFLRSAVKGGGDGGRQPIGDATPAAPIERESLEKPRIIISTKSISDEFYTGGEEEQQHHFDRHTSAIHGSARELCSIDQQSTGNHSPHSPAASSISRLQRSTRQDDDGDWQSTTTGQQLGESTHHTPSSFRSCWKVSNLLKKRHDSLSNAADLESGSRNCDSVKCREEEVPCIGSPLVEPGTEQRTTQDSGDIGNINQTNITSRQGCYQTVPILIVTPRPTNHTLDDGHRHQTSGATGNGASCSSAAGGDGGDDGSMFIDEIIDVRSYISQSRSDISPFARTGSYRSQATDRSSIIHELARGATGTLIGGNGGGTTSHGRPRSSTISAATASWGEMEGTWQTGPPQHARHASVAACSSARLLGPDGASLSPSATSRKDSGIRSNSRRSSIQHQIMLMNQSAALSMHRVSGYFTSSQSSLSGAMVTGMELEQMGRPTTDAASHPPNGSLRGGNGTSIGAHGGSGTGKSCIGPREPHPDPLAACLQQLRKQSDLQLIRCVRDNARSQRSYLVKPPLLPVSLCFKSRLMEKEFRSKAHRFGTDESIGFGTGGMGGIGLGELEGTGPPTLATPKYNTYIDLLVSFAIYLATSTSLFLLSPSVYLESYKVWVCIFVLFSTVQLFALFICTKQVCRRTRKPSVRRSRPITSRSCYDCLLQLASHWYPWHLCGGILMSLPVISILSNFAMMDVTKFRVFEFHYGFLMYICIVHFCNFTQLNWGMRNCMALATAVAFIGIAIGHMVQLSALEMQVGDKGSSLNAAQNGSLGNSDGQEALGRMLHQAQFEWFNNYRVEIYVDLFLLLVLVWFLNREFEIGYRLSFHGSAVASQDKVRVQNMKNQADMLLHNIIPKHVAEQLKNTAKYSENHHDIGIIFASIINFNEMYDESYLGGKEYLRVLNELIADFDELLARPEFRCVEKIKTIGSTFMAASGLDPSCRGENYEHLYALVDFALAMQQVVESFNRDLLEFNLIMRVGYNFGDVTAGVIGTSKLYYDIWGDAVNVASRMDSTGVAGRIQVGSDCVPVLNERYDFEPRGKVYVKGKDHMEVYLLVRKKPDLLGPPELDIDPL